MCGPPTILVAHRTTGVRTLERAGSTLPTALPRRENDTWICHALANTWTAAVR